MFGLVILEPGGRSSKEIEEMKGLFAYEWDDWRRLASIGFRFVSDVFLAAAANLGLACQT